MVDILHLTLENTVCHRDSSLPHSYPVINLTPRNTQAIVTQHILKNTQFKRQEHFCVLIVLSKMLSTVILSCFLCFKIILGGVYNFAYCIIFKRYKKSVEQKSVSFGSCPSATKFCFPETTTVINFLCSSFKRVNADASSTIVYTCIIYYTNGSILDLLFSALEFSLDDIFW